MIKVYCDGSSSKGGSGFGVVAIGDNEEVIYCYSDHYLKATNNRMELEALLHSIEYCSKQDEQCIIYCDSMYCINSFINWIPKWADNGWTTAKGEQVKNLELIKALYEYRKKYYSSNYSITHIKGHNGNLGNELADALATDNYKKYNKLLFDKNKNL